MLPRPARPERPARRTTIVSIAALALLGVVACSSERAAGPPPPAGCGPSTVRVTPPGQGAFCLDARPVSVGDFQQCVGLARCTVPDQGSGCRRDDLVTSAQPVNCVDAAQGRMYCESVAGRLPTRAELEGAAASPAAPRLALGDVEWVAAPGASGTPSALRYAPTASLVFSPEPVASAARRPDLSFRCVHPERTARTSP